MDGSETEAITKDTRNTEPLLDAGHERPLYELPGEPSIREEYHYEEITPESSYVYTAEDIHYYEEQEASAVDLSTTKNQSDHGALRQFGPFKKNKNDVVSLAQLLENIYQSEPSSNKGDPSPSSFLLNVPIAKKTDYTVANCTGYRENPDSVLVTDYSTHQLYYPNTNYKYQKSKFDIQHFRSTGTNTDTVLVVDQGSQTRQREMKNTTMQTDHPEMLIMTTGNEKLANVKYKCSTCQQVFATKSSYDRHTRNHHTPYQRAVTNVKFTMEAKVQVSRRKLIRNQLTRAAKPVIVQILDNDLECDMCLQSFATHTELDHHDCVDPFPMVKCPECSLTCYTLGALNHHLNVVHHKETPGGNYYYCIFCDQSFAAGYNFHLHLNKHLSP